MPVARRVRIHDQGGVPEKHYEAQSQIPENNQQPRSQGSLRVGERTWERGCPEDSRDLTKLRRRRQREPKKAMGLMNAAVRLSSVVQVLSWWP